MVTPMAIAIAFFQKQLTVVTAVTAVTLGSKKHNKHGNVISVATVLVQW